MSGGVCVCVCRGRAVLPTLRVISKLKWPIKKLEIAKKLKKIKKTDIIAHSEFSQYFVSIFKQRVAKLYKKKGRSYAVVI